MEDPMATRLKPCVRTTKIGPLFYQLDAEGRPIRFQPWLADAFAFLYDTFMARSVFPKQFNADPERHPTILSEQLQDIHGQNVLELGTGSGAASEYLPPDNTYTGSDINTGLLKKAVKRFRVAGFQEPEFYIASGDDLPFAAQSFDLCLCILGLNFIGNAEMVFQGVNEILRPGGRWLCVVPIPERNQRKNLIHGTLLTEVRLQKLCHKTGIGYQHIQAQNGALLYFWANKLE
jgi:SAM-dependent methyltransferase